MSRKLAALVLMLGLGAALLAGPTSSAFAVPSDEAAVEGGHPVVAGGADAGHDAPAKPNLLEFKPSLAVSTLIVFLILLAILGKYAWKPLMTALHDREHHLEHTLLETEKARDEAARLIDQHRAELARATDQVRAMIDEARAKAQALKDDLIRQAQDEAESARKRAEREIGAAKDQALLELWNTSAEMAVSVAGKVLPRELNESDHRRLVEQALADLPTAPAGANGQGARA